MTIKCSHHAAGDGIGDGSPRAYKLKLPLPKDSKLPREYHVVAGHTKADKITIELHGGPCSQGKTPLEHVTVSGAEATMGAGGVTFKALAPKVAVVGDPREWVNILWPFNMQPRQYDITTKLCSGAATGSAVVKAYPYVKWELGLSLSLGERSSTGTRGAEISKGGSVDRYVEWEKKTTGWGVGGSAKLTLDNGNYTKNLAADFQQYTQSAFKVMESFKDFASTLQGFLKSTGCGEFTLTLPKIAVVYELETTEDKNDHLLDYVGKASLKLDPLIKVAYKYDVLNWVIGICVNGAAPGLGSAILKIKTRAQEGFSALGAKASIKLSVDMTFSGGIDGEVSWERHAKAGKWSTPQGKVSASVTGEIRAIAKGTADLWLVSLVAGAEAGAKLGFGYDVTAAADSVGLFLQGQLRFDGIVLDYVVYHGSGRISKPPKGQTTDAGDGRTYDQTDSKGVDVTSGSKTIDSKGKAELMKPRYWPEASKAGKHYVIRNRP